MNDSLKRRVDRLEGKLGSSPPGDLEELRRQEEHERREVKRMVEHRINCRVPYFVIAEDGTPLTLDGRPVTDTHQVLAEEFYQMQLEDGADSQLVHDAEAEEFRTPTGELALSRTFCHLERLFRWL